MTRSTAEASGARDLESSGATGGPGRRPDGGRRLGFTTALLLRIVVLGVVDALAVYGLITSFGLEAWGIFVALLLGTVAVNVIYLRRGGTAAKFLVPGTIFLLIFQVYVVLYTGFASFTNFGDGHIFADRADALESILAFSEVRIPDSPAFDLRILQRDGGLAFLLTDGDGNALLGDEEGLTELDPDEVTFDDGTAVGLDGWQTLGLGDVVERQDVVLDLRVPLGGPEEGSIRTQSGTSGFIARSSLAASGDGATITDSRTQTAYRDAGNGWYESDEGVRLTPGWRVGVGISNYTRILDNPALRGPIAGVFVWTFAFAGISVLTTFGLGLLLALVFDSPTMAGRRIYRSLLVLPYAVPSFMSVLVWTGMLNNSFGFINQTLLGGADIAWLNDVWLARLSVLVVNLWLGFPYMMLICTGALQSIPADLKEAAAIDGASAIQSFRRITMPLLLVSIAPLLIASFAFNFNNFTVIYFVTGGGPSIPDAPISVGSTDLLISLVYNLAFGGTGRQWGFATALSVIIFVIVAIISAISFSRTRSLEEIN